MLLCIMDGCDLPRHGHGYCNTHYRRFKSHGDASVTKRPGNSVLLNWIKDHVNYSGEDCLKWPFTTDGHGRGQITIKGKNKKSPRVMCEFANGPPPSSKHDAAHSCGNGHLGCIHPKHLSWKTRKENEADKLIHGTQIRGENTWNNKLTESQVIKIRGLLASGKTCAEVAIAYSMHPGTISQIKRRKLWSWLE